MGVDQLLEYLIDVDQASGSLGLYIYFNGRNSWKQG